MSTGHSAPGNTFKGWHMAAVVGLFFGTVIAVNVLMAYKAISTFPGLNAKNGYVASQTYDRLLQDAAEQDGRGWTSVVETRDGHLALTLLDAGKKSVEGLDVRALVGRPASASTDRELALLPTPRGYETPATLERGKWLAEIVARRNGELVWRETRPVTAD
ncbi:MULTISPECIES: FixH family protein [unclassified Aureimonas]|uniref:FixH family protein n=1 Tax=unclassified Aureimonas TaxID=2615206 RepID=UPI00070EC5C5|nr:MULTISPECIES: FixH family protein [unclassified Aureimonas]KQT55189.1 hypothetical protein ASG62_10125 [Aureimonas sp. Leaf427]KQT70979.1 hypothetical protein ASG54_20510 [Aureimonas sp. Leaf460]